MEENTQNKVHDLIIVGSGPAGLTAGIYAGRARLDTVLLAGEQWGGQLMNTTDVENFPGFPEGIPGPQLMTNMMEQTKKFGADIKYENVSQVNVSGEEKEIMVGDKVYKSKAVIFATGSEPRLLKIPGEEKFYGRGVSTCATCDGAFYKDKVIAVVGGGDSAMEEATFLTRFASKVYLIHRKDEFRASEIMAERAKNNEKIEIMFNTEVKEVMGDQTVNKLKLFKNKDNSESELEVAGLFLAIGHIPVTGYLKDKLPMDENGYIVPLNFGTPKTNVDGVFIAGEIQDHVYKQAITTAGEGCKAALEAQRFIEGNEDIKGTW